MPKFHNLNNNPGLLPLKLGNAQNKIDHWTFIQIFDISNIINEFLTLQKSFLKIKNILENSTHNSSYGREFYNSYYLVNSLENKILTQINQLNPLMSNRIKRGIIDGLGSVIKAITGNLDQEDAKRYDHAINILSSDEIKIKTLIKDQITLLQTSTEKFRKNIETLAHNQIILESRIMQLEAVIKTTKLKDIETYNYFLLEMLISQFITAFQVIYDTLEKIEVAISFSKLNTFHNSIIEPVDLLSDVLFISKQLIKNKLPFDPILENILLFEKIMEIKSYNKNNQIVFIIEIPIVENEYYNYYHLYPLPTPTANSFKVIIPPSQYLLSNEQNYAFLNTKCQEITNEEFICQEINVIKIKDNAPCEVRMLQYSENITNCQQIPVNINDIKIRKLERNQWIVITPKITVATQKCGKTKENIPLNGSYVLQLNNQCEVHVQDITIKTVQKSKINFKNIELPNIKFSDENFIGKTKMNFKPLQIESVNLDEIKNVQNLLNNQKLKLNEISNTPIHFHKVSFYTILLYIVVALIIMFALYKYYCRKSKIIKCNLDKGQNTEIADVELSNFVINPVVLK